MAPIIPNYTGRYNVYYSAAAVKHRLTFRYANTETVPPTELVTGVEQLLAVLAPSLTNTFAIRSAGFQAPGVDIELPFRAPTMVVQPGMNVGHKGVVPSFVGFVGKTFGGRRVKSVIFGWVPNAFNEVDFGRFTDYRLYASEDARVADALEVLHDLPIVGIDNSANIYWKEYANIGFSGYWQRKTRG